LAQVPFGLANLLSTWLSVLYMSDGKSMSELTVCALADNTCRKRQRICRIACSWPSWFCSLRVSRLVEAATFGRATHLQHRTVRVTYFALHIIWYQAGRERDTPLFHVVDIMGSTPAMFYFSTFIAVLYYW
jgi:hypothetical protein